MAARRGARAPWPDGRAPPQANPSREGLIKLNRKVRHDGHRRAAVATHTPLAPQAEEAEYFGGGMGAHEPPRPLPPSAAADVRSAALPDFCNPKSLKGLREWKLELHALPALGSRLFKAR